MDRNVTMDDRRSKESSKSRGILCEMQTGVERIACWMFRHISILAVYLMQKLVYPHTHTDAIYIYIYIYSHPQTDCFVLSELFSVARHAGRPKPGSKPVQLYVRLSLRPLGHQADHVG